MCTNILRQSLIILFLILIPLSFCLYAATVDRILATINDEFITLSDYRLFLKREGYKGAEGVEEGNLKKLIEERLILREAKDKGIISTDEEVEELLDEISKERGISRDQIISLFNGEERDYKNLLKDKIMSLKLIEEEVDSKVVINESETERFYNERREHFRKAPERVEIEILFMPYPSDASVTEITDLKLKSLKVLKMLKEGDDFEWIARRYGEFKGPGSFERGALLNPLNNTVFSLNEGDISNPIWTDDGVYIVKVIKRFEATYQPLEDVKDQIYRILYDNKRAELLNNWLKGLWEKASIIIRD